MRVLSQFVVATVLTSLAPLACLSATAHIHGADAFLALAIGQAVGALIANVSTWGWDVNGPQRVATMSKNDAATELLRSVRTRGAVYAALALPGAVVAWHLNGGAYPWLSVLSALAVGSQGLNPTWWCSGRSTPRDLLKAESVPRAAAAGVAAVLIASGAPPTVYPSLTLAVMAPTYLNFYRSRVLDADRSAQRGVLAELRANADGTGIGILNALYITSLLPLVQLFVPGAALLFAAGQRLLTYANLATITFANAFMGSRTEVQQRRGVAVTLSSSLVLAIGLCLTAPLLSRFLFDIALKSWATPVLVSAIYMGVAVNTAFSKLWLIPHGHQRRVLTSVAVAAAAGPPLTVALALAYGADGGLVGMLGAEVLICCVCLLPRRHTPPEAA